MNRLKTDNIGGVSFEWDDWRFEQNGVREAFLGLVSAWGIDPADSFIISGAQATLNGLNYDISEGFISLNGEIFKVDAHSVVAALGAGAFHFFEEVVTFDPAGLEPTKNAGTVDTYEIRRAQVVNAVPSGSFMPMLAEDIHQKILEKIAPKIVYQTINMASSPDFLQNDAYDGTGNFIVSPQPPQAGSFIKYQILGKMININFVINQVSTTDNTTGAARTMIARLLPFTFKNGVSQFGTCFARSNDADTANGLCRIEVRNELIIFQLTQPQGVPIEWNETAQLSTPPSKNYNTVGGVIPARTWDIVGSITAELN
jgi:hypothetical protein